MVAAPPVASATASASATSTPTSDQEILALVGLIHPEAVAAIEPTPEPTPVEEPVLEEPDPIAEPVDAPPPTAAPTEELFPVPVDGIEEKVTLAELKRGYSGQKKILQTMQQQAQTRDQLARRDADIAAAQERYREKLDLLEQTLTAQAPAEPDWEDLRKESPDAYLAQRAEYDARERKLTLVKAEHAKVREDQQRVASQSMQAFLEQEAQKLVEKLPEWKDQATYRKEASDLETYLLGEGYTEQEVKNVAYHRAIITARKAMLYDRLQQETKPAVQRTVQQAPVALKPGASQPATKPISKVEVARRQLAKTGSPRDAEALMLAKIEAGEF